jgi:hypothetical protein
MVKKNNVIIGFLAGLVLPALTWIIFGYVLKNQVIINNKPLIPYLIALALNLFAAKYLFKKGADQSGAGILLSAFVVMMFAYYFQAYLR